MFNPFRALKSYLRIKRLNRFFRRMSKGGVIFRIDTNTGYQPTESVKTQPPDTISGVQSPKSGSNPNCKGIVYRSKPEGEKQKHEVYIPLETAKRLIEKNKINRLERKIPFPVVVEKETLFYEGGFCEQTNLLCPRCGMRIKMTDKKCKYCFQRVDFKEVTKDA